MLGATDPRADETREIIMDVPELHRRATDAFDQRVRAIGDDQWHLPTPCSEWDVRDLVNHVTAEDLWTAPLLAGQTIEQVGDRFDGDVLGSDPKGAWARAVAEARQAVQEEGAMERTVHLSFGDFPGGEYALQLFTDHLIHAWDLARAIGADETLDDDLVAACAEWFDAAEDSYRAGGAIADAPEVPADADAQTRLLARFGRRA